MGGLGTITHFVKGDEVRLGDAVVAGVRSYLHPAHRRRLQAGVPLLQLRAAHHGRRQQERAHRVHHRAAPQHAQHQHHGQLSQREVQSA